MVSLHWLGWIVIEARAPKRLRLEGNKTTRSNYRESRTEGLNAGNLTLIKWHLCGAFRAIRASHVMRVGKNSLEKVDCYAQYHE